MAINLKNSIGISRNITTGFSWTTLLFSIFVPLFRGDFKWFFVMLISALITSGISTLIFPFFYNDIYIKNQIDKGWLPVGKEDKVYVQKIYQQNPIKKIIKAIFVAFALFIVTGVISGLIKWYKLEENKNHLTIQQVKKEVDTETKIQTDELIKKEKLANDFMKKIKKVCDSQKDGFVESDCEFTKVTRYKCFCKNNEIDNIEFYQDEKLTSKWLWKSKVLEVYDDKGKMRTKIFLEYVEDMKHFIIGDILKVRKYRLETYNQNSKIEEKSIIENGKGTYETYYETGVLKSKMFIVNNKAEGIYEEYYKNGKIKERGFYSKDLQDGIFETFYPNGNIQKRRPTKKGNDHGQKEFFYENGNLQAVINFVEGIAEGVMEEYNIDGSIKRQVDFKDGLAIRGQKYDRGISNEMTRAELYNEYNKKK